MAMQCTVAALVRHKAGNLLVRFRACKQDISVIFAMPAVGLLVFNFTILEMTKFLFGCTFLLWVSLA
jgi:hypothetical protein